MMKCIAVLRGAMDDVVLRVLDSEEDAREYCRVKNHWYSDFLDACAMLGIDVIVGVVVGYLKMSETGRPVEWVSVRSITNNDLTKG